MGKAGRFACIFVPMVLTLGSLICQALVFSGQLNKHNSLQRDLYFFRANTSDFKANGTDNKAVDEANKYFNSDLLQALQGSANAQDLKDVYYIGLWNYCEAEYDDKGKENITHCSPRKAEYWFNVTDVWGLSNTTLQKEYPGKWDDGLNTYHKVSKWMFVAFVIAIILTASELIVGIFAIFSRWGSFVTTIVSTAQTFFLVAAAITATALYATLVGLFDLILKPYHIKAEMGAKMLAVMWLAVAFSIASGFFWTISVCCCSGKSGHKKTVVEKTPYTYERVASPYMGHAESGHELLPQQGHGTSGSAYEPFRQQHV